MEFQRQPRESKRKRFKPWENIRRMFQRKNSSASDHQPKGRSSSSSRLSNVLGLASTTMSSRSRSTSELLTTEPIGVSASTSNNNNNRTPVSVGSLGASLSVSHDSVFGMDISPESPETYSPPSHHRHRTTHESLPSSASLQYMSELRAAIGIRHRSAEDDEGLPRSPKNATPTTAQILLDSMIQNNTGRSAGASGSDPSLLSINSCELEEAPFSSLADRNQQSNHQQQQQHAAGKVIHQQPAASHHQSISTTDVGGRLDSTDDGLLVMAASLNHSAARHKMSIRPKRNHAPARPRQLPQLAESLVEGVNHPPAENEDQPSIPERKNRTGRRSTEPISGSTHVKPRSVSLSRTEDSIIRDLPFNEGVDPDPTIIHPSTGSSSVKLARSKSSVEKKIQHEVAVFWRRTKEGKLFHRKENNPPVVVVADSKDPTTSTVTHQDGSKAENDQIKRKDLRKIKRDKEEKRKKSDASAAAKDDSSPPFLSRIFGSRRSGRRKKATPTPPSPTPPDEYRKSPSPQPPQASQVGVAISKTEPVPVPKPRTIFHSRSPVDKHMVDEGDDAIEWPAASHSPYHFAPSSVTRQSIPSAVPGIQSSRLVEKWAETDQLIIRPAPMTSPKINRSTPTPTTVEDFQVGGQLPSPLPARHHRIHIAGLSPYQRRVARIGNGLEISDEEWDEPEVNSRRSYHFRPDERLNSHLSLNAENHSLPVNINQDFILKKAALPVEEDDPPPPAANDLIRRSFELLKFGNEGLKKTIDSLNPKRISQSSDQLHLSDASGGRRESSVASLSNSTSSLDISDADDTMDTNGSMISLLQSADEKDAHEDILIVHHHKESIQEPGARSETSHSNRSWSESPSGLNLMTRNAESIGDPLFTSDPSSSHPDIPAIHSFQPAERPATSPPATGETEIRIKSPEGERMKSKPHKTWESRQMIAGHSIDPPMFSMSVRVQNPPDMKFKRSMSTPTNPTILSVHHQPESAIPNDGIHHVSEVAPNVVGRKSLDNTYVHSAPRPFIMSVRMGADGDGSVPAALPAQQLMAKLSARPWQSKEDKDRQNKVALSVVAKSQPVESTVQMEQPCNDTRTVEVAVIGGSSQAETETAQSTHYPAIAADVKLRPKKSGADKEETSELLKVFARRSLKVRDSGDMTESAANLVTTLNEIVPDVKPDMSSNSRSASPNENRPENTIVETTQPVESTDLSKSKKFSKIPVTIDHDRVLKSTGKPPAFFRAGIHEPSAPVLIRQPFEEKNPPNPADEINNTKPDNSSPPEEIIWKKQGSAKPKPIDRFGSKFQTKSIDEEVKAATAVPPARQSKVLDMVHNFQRLQVT